MIDRDTVIALAEKHATCTSSQHKEFLHDELIAFVGEISQMAAEAEREACADACEQLAGMAATKESRAYWMRIDCAHTIRARSTGGEG